MQFTNYDFVGNSSSQLPYVHDSFPAGPKLGTARYCTTRSMYRGRDAERKRDFSLQQMLIPKSEKEIMDIKLPKLNLDVDNPVNRKYRNLSVTPSGNIYRQKAYYRLKGIRFDKLFSLNRNKSEEPKQEIKEEKQNKKAVSFASTTETKLPSVVSYTDSVLESETNKSDESEVQWKSRLRELDRESPIPGILRPKKSRQGRKLGNIVSSRRLQQLLDNEEALDAGAFYYY